MWLPTRALAGPPASDPAAVSGEQAGPSPRETDIPAVDLESPSTAGSPGPSDEAANSLEAPALAPSTTAMASSPSAPDEPGAANPSAANPSPNPAEAPSPATTKLPGSQPGGEDDAHAAEYENSPAFMRELKLGKESLVLGGYIQPGFVYVADTAFNDDDHDGFDFANARLTGRGEKNVVGKLDVGFRFNFDVNRGNFGVRDVYGSVSWRDGLVGFDIGQFKQPFSLALIQSESRLQFAFSPQIRQLAFGRDQGARLRSQGMAGPVWLSAQVMVANGEGGFRQRRNIDDAFQYTGRVEIGPMGPLAMSEPDLEASKKPRLVLGFAAGHTPKLGKGFGVDDVGTAESRVEGDLRFAWRGLSIRGEYLHAWRSANDAGPAFQRYGAVAQVGYVLPIPIEYPRFEVVFRYQQLDVDMDADGTEGDDYVVDDTSRRLLEPGLNIYLLGHAAKLMLSYQLTDLLEGPRTDTNGAPLYGDTVFAFFQFAWL